jgi:hypothetical protein
MNDDHLFNNPDLSNEDIDGECCAECGEELTSIMDESMDGHTLFERKICKNVDCCNFE